MQAEVKRNPDYTVEKSQAANKESVWLWDLTFQYTLMNLSVIKKHFSGNLHGSLGIYIIEEF